MPDSKSIIGVPAQVIPPIPHAAHSVHVAACTGTNGTIKNTTVTTGNHLERMMECKNLLISGIDFDG
ncbi:MAG: hypothetical protein WCV88_05225 [Patescibacteria group bacterium]